MALACHRSVSPTVGPALPRLRTRGVLAAVSPEQEQGGATTAAPQEAAPSRNSRPSAPASSGTAQPRPRMPSLPPGVIMGPDGRPLKVVAVENTGEDAWAGVAAVDRGENDEPTAWGRIATLVAGDCTALVLFAAVGRLNHGEPLDGGTLATALPFLLGWLAAAPFLGGFGRGATAGEVGPAAATAAKCWAAGIPLGLLLRTAARGHAAAAPFYFVSLAVTAVLLVGWRTAYAALTPTAAPLTKAARAARRTDRRGNPLEFLQLLMSLTKRW